MDITSCLRATITLCYIARTSIFVRIEAGTRVDITSADLPTIGLTGISACDLKVAVISLNGEARGDNDIARANARLIASAPDLLEALERVAELGGLSSEGFDDYEDLANADDLACEILDAIKKAKGEK